MPGFAGALRFRSIALLAALAAAPLVAEAGLRPDATAAEKRLAVRAEYYTRFDRIADLVTESNVPQLIGSARWGELVEAYRPLIEQATSHRVFAETVNTLIEACGISHFHYYTDDDWFYWHLHSVFGGGGPDGHVEHIGLFTERLDDRWYVRGVLEGSVAASTGICVGDELLSVDGQPFEPIAGFRDKAGRPVHLRIRRRPGMIYNLVVTPVKESLHEAVQRAIVRSIRVIDFEGHRFAYLHAWTLLGRGEEYRKLLEMQDDVEGLLLDYRDGFGGITNPAMRFLFGTDNGRDYWAKPTVILIADGTRSAKEIVVDEVKRRQRALLLGTPTPGHVVSVGGLQHIGSNGLLMLPGHRFELEGHPTEPDYLIERDIRYSVGADPQLGYAKELLADLVCE